jgi:hypothetical protein
VWSSNSSRIGIEPSQPDLTVEYLFYEQGKKGLHFFNKVKPQDLKYIARHGDAAPWIRDWGWGGAQVRRFTKVESSLRTQADTISPLGSRGGTNVPFHQT